MNRSVTVSIKGVLAAIAVALALIVAYLLGNVGNSAQAAPAAAPTTDHPRTLVMTGTGKTVGVPDELSFNLSVGLLRGSLNQAMADANATTSRVLAALAKVGVNRSDVQTTGLGMHAVYDYHSDGTRTLRGYHVAERAQVLVRNLGDGGRAISAAVAAGGDAVRVGNIGLKVGDSEQLLAQSRDAAVKDAKAKAQEYADATGQTLGSVLSLREVHASAPATQPLHFAREATLNSLKALPIRAGRDHLAVTVRIVWELS